MVETKCGREELMRKTKGNFIKILLYGGSINPIPDYPQKLLVKCPFVIPSCRDNT